jgi:hypothetical protein
MMAVFSLLRECTGFEWDKYNSEKSWEKHKVTRTECEQIFFNQPLIVVEDIKHSQRESRYYALGHTDLTRKLFVVFTIREELVRVITARDMSRKERRVYESYGEQDPKIQE